MKECSAQDWRLELQYEYPATQENNERRDQAIFYLHTPSPPTNLAGWRCHCRCGRRLGLLRPSPRLLFHCQALVVVVHHHRQDLFRLHLPNHHRVESRENLARKGRLVQQRRAAIHRCAGSGIAERAGHGNVAGRRRRSQGQSTAEKQPRSSRTHLSCRHPRLHRRPEASVQHCLRAGFFLPLSFPSRALSLSLSLSLSLFLSLPPSLPPSLPLFKPPPPG